MAYEPKIPSDAPQLKVDTADWRYQALHDYAEKNGWGQDQFSKALADEARRVAAATRPAPLAASAPAAKPNFSKMSVRDQFHHAVMNSPGRKPLR
jgi:hypothetical protein